MQRVRVSPRDASSLVVVASAECTPSCFRDPALPRGHVGHWVSVCVVRAFPELFWVVELVWVGFGRCLGGLGSVWLGSELLGRCVSCLRSLGEILAAALLVGLLIDEALGLVDEQVCAFE